MTTEESTVVKTDQSGKSTDHRYDLVQWRREQVLKLRAKGYSYDKIAYTLKAGHPDVSISHGTIASDIKAIKEEVNSNLRDYIQKDIPYEVKLCQTGIIEILKEAWQLAESTRDEKVKIAALSLAKDAYLTQNALLGDSKVLDQTIQWLKKAKKQLKEEEGSSANAGYPEEQQEKEMVAQ